MAEWLRGLVLRWLRIGAPVGSSKRWARFQEDYPDLAEALDERLGALAWRPSTEDKRIEMLLRKVDTSVRQVLDTDAKFEAMAMALGVHVIVDGQGARVVGMSDESFLKNLKEFLAATAAMDRVLEAQARALRGQTQLLVNILARRAKP